MAVQKTSSLLGYASNTHPMNELINKFANTLTSVPSHQKSFRQEVVKTLNELGNLNDEEKKACIIHIYNKHNPDTPRLGATMISLQAQEILGEEEDLTNLFSSPSKTAIGDAANPFFSPSKKTEISFQSVLDAQSRPLFTQALDIEKNKNPLFQHLPDHIKTEIMQNILRKLPSPQILVTETTSSLSHAQQPAPTLSIHSPSPPSDLDLLDETTDLSHLDDSINHYYATFTDPEHRYRFTAAVEREKKDPDFIEAPPGDQEEIIKNLSVLVTNPWFRPLEFKTEAFKKVWREMGSVENEQKLNAFRQNKNERNSFLALHFNAKVDVMKEEAKRIKEEEAAQEEKAFGGRMTEDPGTIFLDSPVPEALPPKKPSLPSQELKETDEEIGEMLNMLKTEENQKRFLKKLNKKNADPAFSDFSRQEKVLQIQEIASYVFDTQRLREDNGWVRDTLKTMLVTPQNKKEFIDALNTQNADKKGFRKQPYLKKIETMEALAFQIIAKNLSENTDFSSLPKTEASSEPTPLSLDNDAVQKLPEKEKPLSLKNKTVKELLSGIKDHQQDLKDRIQEKNSDRDFRLLSEEEQLEVVGEIAKIIQTQEKASQSKRLTSSQNQQPLSPKAAPSTVTKSGITIPKFGNLSSAFHKLGKKIEETLTSPKPNQPQETEKKETKKPSNSDQPEKKKK